MRRIYPPEESRELPGDPPSPYPDLVLPEPGSDRPFCCANMAMTLDGKVVSGNPIAGYLLSGTEGDRRGMAELRARVDAVMIGAGTLRVENPVMRVAYPDLRERRRREGRPEDPQAIVATASGRIDPKARWFERPGAVVVTCATGRDSLPSEIVEKAVVVVAGTRTLDLLEAIRILYREHGVHRLLVEGGPTLTYHFLAGGWIDELFVTVAPIIKSGRDTPTLVEGSAFAYSRLPRLSLISMAVENDEIYARYRLSPTPILSG